MGMFLICIYSCSLTVFSFFYSSVFGFIKDMQKLVNRMKIACFSLCLSIFFLLDHKTMNMKCCVAVHHASVQSNVTFPAAQLPVHININSYFRIFNSCISHCLLDFSSEQLHVD